MRRGGDPELVSLGFLSVFGVAAGYYELDPSIVLPVAAVTYGTAYTAMKQEAARAALAAFVVAVVVLPTDVPPYVFTAAVLAVAGGELSARLVSERYGGDGVEAGSYLLGGGVAAAAGSAWMAVELAAVALVVVCCVYTAVTVRSMGFGVGWSLLAAAVAGGFAAVVPVDPGFSFVVAAAAVTLSFGAAAYRARVMTLPGAAAGVLLTFVLILAGGFSWFLVLGFFVLLGTLSTRYAADWKRENGYGHDDPRGIANVASNGSVGFVAAVAYAFASGWGWGAAPVLEACFVASVATAAADTASSEVGVVHGRPRLVTDLSPVEPGVDGGVSLTGEAVALLASAAVAVLAVGMGVFGVGFAAAVAAAGFVGCNVDSVLGASLEDRLLTNESVNLLACAAGAAAAVPLASLL